MCIIEKGIYMNIRILILLRLRYFHTPKRGVGCMVAEVVEHAVFSKARSGLHRL